MTDADYVEMEKSTIVRSFNPPRLLPLVRTTNRALSALAPALAARLATRRFTTPSRPRRPAPEIELLATARARPMQIGTRRIETWLWGTGPSVLLVHGWGGRGAQLGALVGPLVARGFSATERRTKARSRSRRSRARSAPSPSRAGRSPRSSRIRWGPRRPCGPSGKASRPAPSFSSGRLPIW